MNPARIHTLAQHERMQRLNAAFYADVQRSARSEHAAYRAEPVKHLQVVPDAPAPKVSETRVCVYFLIAAAFIFAGRYVGVFA